VTLDNAISWSNILFCFIFYSRKQGASYNIPQGEPHKRLPKMNCPIKKHRALDTGGNLTASYIFYALLQLHRLFVDPRLD